MLEIEDIHAFYGKSHILQGVSLSVRQGELVTLLGRNGAGKTTTLKTVMGLLRPRQGRILYEGRDIGGGMPHVIARSGIALVPEHRGIFSLLSVQENLEIAARKGSRWAIRDVYALFPRLEERRRNSGGVLSGGEQQMLAIARALVNGPRLLLLDEPTEGLAPVIVEELVKTLAQIKREGVPILLVEQNLGVCMRLADRHTVIELGRTVYTGDPDAFAQDESIRDRYLVLKGV